MNFKLMDYLPINHFKMLTIMPSKTTMTITEMIMMISFFRLLMFSAGHHIQSGVSPNELSSLDFFDWLKPDYFDLY